MAVDPGPMKTRRSILAGALAGVGVVAVEALGHPADVAAASNGNVQLGHGTADTDNDAAAETRVNGTTDGMITFSAWQTGSGTGLKGATGTGWGVQGTASTTGTGVSGSSSGGTGVNGGSTNGVGVVGFSQTNAGIAAESTSSTGLKAASDDNNPSAFSGESHKTGVLGTAGATTNAAVNTDETGIYGYCDVSANSIGVVGQSHQGVGAIGVGAIGVAGIGSWALLGDVAPTQVGVYGNTGVDAAPSPGTGIGVAARAQSTSQIALKVMGRVQFSRSGRTAISAGTSSKTVTMAGVTTASYVIATPQTNRTGLFVQAVVPYTGKFVIYLNKAVAATTYIGFLVIN